MKSVALSAILIAIILVGCSNGEQTAIEQPPNVDPTVAPAVTAARTTSDVQEKVVATLSAPTPTTALPTPTAESVATLNAPTPTPTPEPAVTASVNFNLGDFNLGDFNLGDFNLGDFNLGDIESIGWTMTEDLTESSHYPGLQANLDGEIELDGESNYVGIYIFEDGYPDDFTKEQLHMLGLMVSARVQFLGNIVVGCHTENVCEHVINKLK